MIKLAVVHACPFGLLAACTSVHQYFHPRGKSPHLPLLHYSHQSAHLHNYVNDPLLMQLI